MITLAIILGIFAGMGLFFYRMGKKSQREKDTQETLETVRKRNDIERDVKTLSDADLDRRLNRWMRK